MKKIILITMIMFAVTAFADSVLDKMIGVWNEVNYHDGELTISKEGDDYFVEYIDFSEESEPEYLVKKRKISVVDDKYFDIDGQGNYFYFYNDETGKINVLDKRKNQMFLDNMGILFEFKKKEEK